MKAMIIESFGAPELFKLNDIEKPKIKEGHVIVNIKATSVNTVDTMIREMGHDLPFSPKLPAVLGMDFAGVITEVGKNVENFKVGDEVYGCAGGLSDIQGTLAEFMLADAALIAKKPKSLTMKEAAAIPLVGITAYEGLTRANLNKNQKILIHGGAGGVGHVAIQLALYLGGDVYSTGSNRDQLELISNFGATAINYKESSVEEYVQTYTSGKGFDVIFDTVGGENLNKSFEAAALNAQVSTTVSLLKLDLTPIHLKGLSLNVVFMLIPMIHKFKREEHGEILSKLADIIDEGKLKPIVDPKNFSLSLVGEAHKHLQSGNAIGKVVIEI